LALSMASAVWVHNKKVAFGVWCCWCEKERSIWALALTLLLSVQERKKVFVVGIGIVVIVGSMKRKTIGIVDGVGIVE